MTERVLRILEAKSNMTEDDKRRFAAKRAFNATRGGNRWAAQRAEDKIAAEKLMHPFKSALFRSENDG